VAPQSARRIIMKTTTITVERLADLDLITANMYKNAAEEGIEEVELSRGGLLSIKGVGEKRAANILDALEDELTQEEEETTTKEKEGEEVEETKNDNRVILKDSGIVEEARVNAFYLGDESVTLDGKTYVADITVKQSVGADRHIQVSMKDGGLIQETDGRRLNSAVWANVKAGLLRAYKNELALIEEGDEEILISGEQLQEAVESGIADYYVIDANYHEELTDKDLVGTVALTRTDGSSIYGDAVFYNGKIEFNFEDALTKVTTDEVPDSIKKKLLDDLRREYKKAEAEFKQKQRELEEFENPGSTIKKKEEKDPNVNEVQTEGINPIKKTEGDKEVVEVVDGMVVKINGRRQMKPVPAADYFADKTYDTKKSTPKETKKSTSTKTSTSTDIRHGLNDWAISKTRDTLKGINNGTLVAELELEAVNGKKAQFAAVYYNGSLQFFNKDGENHLNNKYTAQFLTDQVREAYGYTK